MIENQLPEVDPVTGLDDLHREITRDSRRRRTILSAAAAAVLLVAAAGAAFLTRDTRPDVVAPVDPTNWIIVEAPGGTLLVSHDGLTTKPAPDPAGMWNEWSPDGRQLAYWARSPKDDVPELWVSDLDGKDKRVVARCDTCSGNYTPAVGWSPDGTMLAYDGPSASGRGSLELLTLANDETRSIALPRGGFAAPRWSPDGTHIAMLEQVGYGGYVALLDPATGASSLHRVTRNMHGIKRVDWSPDGTQIAFTAGSFDFSVGTTSNLYVVNADGTGQRRVTHVTRGQRVAGVDWVSSDEPFLAGFSDVGVDASNAVVVRIGADGSIHPLEGSEGPIYGSRPRQIF